MVRFFALPLLAVFSAPAFAQSTEFSLNFGQSVFRNNRLTAKDFTTFSYFVDDGFRTAFRMTFNTRRFTGHEVGYSYNLKTIIEPFRIKSVEPMRQTTPEQREVFLRTGRLQPVPHRRRPHPHRPADRFRHQRHVHRAMGGHDARRRILRRQRELRAL
jgi:hypothetical protein